MKLFADWGFSCKTFAWLHSKRGISLHKFIGEKQRRSRLTIGMGVSELLARIVAVDQNVKRDWSQFGVICSSYLAWVQDVVHGAPHWWGNSLENEKWIIRSLHFIYKYRLSSTYQWNWIFKGEAHRKLFWDMQSPQEAALLAVSAEEGVG